MHKKAQRNVRNEVRIIGGKWKGRKLLFKGDASLRPTLGRTRETLFNWLRGDLAGMRVWDAFAGSGILGIEALSQGAGFCLFTETNRVAGQALKENLTLLGATGESAVLNMDARRLRRDQTNTGEAYDLVLLDPPFSKPALLQQTVETVLKQSLLGHYLYVESRREQTLKEISVHFNLPIHRTTRSGDAHAALLAAQLPDG